MDCGAWVDERLLERVRDEGQVEGLAPDLRQDRRIEERVRDAAEADPSDVFLQLGQATHLLREYDGAVEGSSLRRLAKSV